MNETDVIVVGAGLSGLVAAAEVIATGKRVIIIDQENAANLGGQAFWSLGGLFLVNSLEQRRLGIHDSYELARQDWLSTAGFDRAEDYWPQQWAEKYLEFASGEMRAWLHARGIRLFPVVAWAERGGYLASGPGNSVPRFHFVKGIGPGVIKPFITLLKQGEKNGLVQFYFRHRVTELIMNGGNVTGVRGIKLADSHTERGVPSNRTAVEEFSLHSQSVIVTSGGIGANEALVKKYWPERMGKIPSNFLIGVPDYVDGSMLPVASDVGANIINSDRMWHYPEGLNNFAPVWSKHAIRILSGPSPLWLDARGTRLPSPLFPGCDTLGALNHICMQGDNYSWFLLNKTIISREFALSGSEQNPDLVSKSTLRALRRALPGAPNPVTRFIEAGLDIVTHKHLSGLVQNMNALTQQDLIDPTELKYQVSNRDRQVDCRLGKDSQLMTIRAARRYLGDRIFRVAKINKMTSIKDGPMIAVRLSIMTRKTLGGIQTDLNGRVLQKNGAVLQGLFAAGEVSGFGGGGMHGYRALEGTFLGGCLFSGMMAGRAAAAAII